MLRSTANAEHAKKLSIHRTAIYSSEFALRYLFARFSRQNAVVGVHREKSQQWIVQVVQPLLGFKGCAANAALSRENLFVVVGRVINNRKRSIELLGKYGADDLVREGHLREGYLLVGARVDLGAKAIGATDNKDEAFNTTIHSLLEPLGILDRTKL